MFCQSCGGKIKEGARFCAGCGSAVAGGAENLYSPPPNQTVPVQNNVQFTQPSQSTSVQKTDKQSIGFNILGFLIPLVGLILFFVFKSSSPKKAKGTLLWAGIGFALFFLIGILSESFFY